MPGGSLKDPTLERSSKAKKKKKKKKAFGNVND